MSVSAPSTTSNSVPDNLGPAEPRANGDHDKNIDDKEKTAQSQNQSDQQAAQASPNEHQYPTGLALFAVLVPMALAFFLVFLDLAIVSTATPSITSTFNSLVDVGWYGGAYQLGGSALQPLTGKIYTYFSTRWSFLSFFFLFMLGSLLCGAAQSSAMFIVGRAVAGMGSSGLNTGAFTIVAATLPPHIQPRVMGLTVGLGQLGLALGPIVGGLFTEYVSWRWCFYINLPVGAPVAVLLFFFRVPEQTPKQPVRAVLGTAIKALDLVGFALVSPAAIMFLLALMYGGNQHAWDSSVVIGLLVGAATTLAVFLAWEHRRGDDAMVPFAMLRHRVIWSAAGNLFFVLASMLVADFYLAIFFQAVNGDSPVMSGVHLLPTTLGMVVFTMTSGVLIEVLGYYLPWVLAGSCISAIGYGLLSTLETTTPAARWIGYQLFYGVGGGSMAAAAYTAVQNLVPASQIPTAMAIVLFCQSMGGAVSLVAANAIFSNSLRQQLQQRAGAIGLDPEAIINAGASAVRLLVSGDALEAVLQAYAKSVDHVMYLGVAVSVAAFAFAWGLGWEDIRVVRKRNAIRASNAETDGPGW
ncbi:major facilitator superfamily domain-containing protein [Lasiosphaeria ovina]|uniref:Major facilitator superfamily domain-containing protein n=1 Tax=Lasiosphaeria ovina TaxID=92902 RepID=A0AAE0TT08_9PEZI|nr:major facilitator superfamily domain-containing protein [Lasiosphaeria ovina]